MMHIFISIVNVFYAVFFRRKRFSAKVSLNNIEFIIWECPGKWCDTLTINKILRDAREIAIAYHSGENIPEYGILSEGKDALTNRIITIGYDKNTKKPLGFSAQVYLDGEIGNRKIEILHLGLVYVIPEYQKKSLLGFLYILPSILILLKRRFRPIWISNVSQVPAVIGAVADYYQRVFPDPIEKARQTSLHKSLGEHIFKFHRKTFGVGEEAIYDSANHLILNAYTGGSDNLKKNYKKCALHREIKVNSFCHKMLNYERGDDVLQIGLLSGELVSRFIKKRKLRYSKLFLFFFPLLKLFLTNTSTIKIKHYKK